MQNPVPSSLLSDEPWSTPRFSHLRRQDNDAGSHCASRPWDPRDQAFFPVRDRGRVGQEGFRTKASPASGSMDVGRDVERGARWPGGPGNWARRSGDQDADICCLTSYRSCRVTGAFVRQDWEGRPGPGPASPALGSLPSRPPLAFP